MDNDKKFPNSGALFQREANGKRPTWSGPLELDGKLLRELVEEYKRSGEAKLQLSGWDRQGRKGDWISIRCERDGAWKERAPSRDTRDNRERDRGTTRNRYEEEDRRPQRGRDTEAPREKEGFDDDIPF